MTLCDPRKGSIMVLNNQSQLSLDGEGGLYVVGDPKEPQSTQEGFILDVQNKALSRYQE